MSFLRFVLFVAIAAALVLPAEAVPPPADTVQVAAAFRVTRPGSEWTWIKDASDPRAVTLSQARLGLEVVVRLVGNSASLSSDRVARILRHRLMEASNAPGHQFTTIHKGRLAGLAAARFNVEQPTRNGMHRTVYWLAAHGKSVVMVAVMGGGAAQRAHEAEIERILHSIALLGK